MFISHMASVEGSRYHELANQLIRMKVKLPKTGATLNMYVNDAIGYRMNSEQPLYYSENAFGTCDAISFRRGLLRIHDLKMGVTPTYIRQLEIYAALFCLEYLVKPHDIDIELRIYQSDERRKYEGDPDTIAHIMDRIKVFDKRIKELKKGELS